MDTHVQTCAGFKFMYLPCCHDHCFRLLPKQLPPPSFQPRVVGVELVEISSNALRTSVFLLDFVTTRDDRVRPDRRTPNPPSQPRKVTILFVKKKYERNHVKHTDGQLAAIYAFATVILRESTGLINPLFRCGCLKGYLGLCAVPVPGG